MLQIQYLSVYKGGLSVDTMTVGEFPVYAALIMLVVDCIVYLLLTVLADVVMTGWLLRVFRIEKMLVQKLDFHCAKHVQLPMHKHSIVH